MSAGLLLGVKRRFGRFAFPTLISNGPLRHLRNRAKEKHDVNSEVGQVYRAISQFRLRAAPNFDTKGALVAFHVVVDPEKTKAVGRVAILDELKKVAGPSEVRMAGRALPPRGGLLRRPDAGRDVGP